MQVRRNVIVVVKRTPHVPSPNFIKYADGVTMVEYVGGNRRNKRTDQRAFV